MKTKLKLITRNKPMTILLLILMLILLGNSLYTLYALSLLKNIENFLRLCGGIIIIIFILLFFLFSVNALIKNKKVPYITIIFFIIVYSVGLLFVSYNIKRFYSKISNMTAIYTTYSSSIVTRIDNKVNSLKDMGNAKIGILNDEKSTDGYIIPKEIIENNNLNNELVSYDNYVLMLFSLLSEEIDYVFLPTNYDINFKNIEGLDNLIETTKIIHTEDKNIKKEPPKKSSINKPFTLLIMGVDSVAEKIAGSSFNGDALMLITFNPDTLNTTMLSIPRDTYVPITCFRNNRENKITHAAWYGEECMIDTIENFTGIDIDYYVKINFKGVVKLVDALEGVKVDVPYSFCEQNSQRKWGKNTIYVKKGINTLNGEQALALARNRKTSKKCSSEWNMGNRNDFVRGKNQQLIVKGLLDKAKDIKSLDTLYNLLDTISLSMETNMSTEEILSFYNIGKDIITKSKDKSVSELLGIQRLVLKTHGLMIYDYSTYDNQGMKRELSTQIAYPNSIQAIINAMKENLGLKKVQTDKNFSFDINEPYEEKAIGDITGGKSIQLLPDFVGKKVSHAKYFAEKNGLTLEIEYITSKIKTDFVGMVASQSIHRKMDLKYVDKSIPLIVTVVEKVIAEEFNYSTCALEENKENPNCLFENLVGKDVSVIDTWKNKYKISIITNLIAIDETDNRYDSNKKGVIISQNIPSGTSIFDMQGSTLNVEYIKKDSTDNPEEPYDPINID